jgi:hypothetical protein
MSPVGRRTSFVRCSAEFNHRRTSVFLNLTQENKHAYPSSICTHPVQRAAFGHHGRNRLGVRPRNHAGNHFRISRAMAEKLRDDMADCLSHRGDCRAMGTTRRRSNHRLIVRKRGGAEILPIVAKTPLLYLTQVLHDNVDTGIGESAALVADQEFARCWREVCRSSRSRCCERERQGTYRNRSPAPSLSPFSGCSCNPVRPHRNRKYQSTHRTDVRRSAAPRRRLGSRNGRFRQHSWRMSRNH